MYGKNVRNMTSYEPKVAPRQYQIDALAKMTGARAFALLHYMRTGKTKTLLDDFGRLEFASECGGLLVIAPGGVYKTWLSQIEEHLSIDLAKRVKVHVWESGRVETEAFLDEINVSSSFPAILLVNVEALSSVKSGSRKACERFLERYRARGTMIAVDESVIIKNHKALRTKYVCNVLAPRAKYRRILSGLPAPRSPLDLFAQFYFLDPAILGYNTYLQFMRHYAITEEVVYNVAQRWPATIVKRDKYGYPIYRNLDELARKIEPWSHRVEFRPKIPSTYSIREVTMTEEQQRLYDSLRTKATAALNDAGAHVTADLVITQMLRMHQVLCGHVRDEEGKLHQIMENKTRQLLELLDDYSGKAIIWCSYGADVQRVSEALKREYGSVAQLWREYGSVAQFWGGNLESREMDELRFWKDPTVRFMVGTPNAGGRGRKWDVADLVVYYSSTNDLDLREQSEQRALSVEKNRGVDYVDLITPDTVEVKILRALRNKIDLASVITKDNWREWVI
jgi:hypothetical protein